MKLPVVFTMPRSRRCRRADLGAVVVLAALTGCITAGSPYPRDARLFREVFGDVNSYHLVGAPPDRLASAALGRLVAADPTLAIDRRGRDLVLRHGTDAVRFTVPATADSDGWATLAGRVMTAARAMSPAVAATPEAATEESMVNAALGTLDRYSHYVRPPAARERDSIVGVGVTLDIRPAEVLVTSVIPDTPAAAAGIEVADRIVAVDGTAAATLSPDSIRERMRGPPNSMLTLELARAGREEPLTLMLRRALIVRPTVTAETSDGIAWLHIRKFDRHSADRAALLLRQAHHEAGNALHGIVIDLRDNPGGLLVQAVALASLFIDRGMVTSTVGRAPESIQSFPARPADRVETLPVVVLVNGGSASSAEIVAAALQDARRAVIVGSASYGKGTVQMVQPTSEGGELTLTWAELVAPLGYRLQANGVVPTVCTSGGTDLDTLQASLNADPARLAVPREALDADGWTRLRASCPPDRIRRALDRDVARRLIDDSALYHAALIVAPLDAGPSAARRS